MGFRQEFIDWFIKKVLWNIFIGGTIALALIVIMVIGLIDIILIPIELIISLIINKNILMCGTDWVFVKVNVPFNKIDEFEKKYIKKDI